MMFLFARHFAGLLNNNHVQLKLPWLLESQLHGSRRKSYLSVPFFFHLRYEWLVRGRLYMPNLRYELHHRICKGNKGTVTVPITRKQKQNVITAKSSWRKNIKIWRQVMKVLCSCWFLIIRIGYQVGKSYQKYCWDILSIMVVIMSTAITIYFGEWIKSVLLINLIVLLLLV